MRGHDRGKTTGGALPIIPELPMLMSQRVDKI